MSKQKPKAYRAAENARFDDEVAERIGAAIDAMGGTCNPRALVEAARPARSPIHDLFEWNDKRAGEQFRLSQAGYYIRHIVVEVVVKDNPRNVRAFHSVNVVVNEDQVERRYVAMPLVLKNADASGQVVARAQAELDSWRDRYETYREIFGPVFDAIDSLGRQRTGGPRVGRRTAAAHA